MRDKLGWLGLILLVATYIIYASINNLLLFTISNITATTILTIYAFLKRDIVFTLVNGFIDVMLGIKLCKLLLNL